jgi:nucleotide-binding universal stress UspA family protein
MKILIAIDGSECSDKAIKHVVSNLGWFVDPELHLFHVQAPIPTVRAEAVLGEDAIRSYYTEESTAAMATAEKLMQETNVPFRASYAVGDVAMQIDAYAQKHGIDMVVMGSHGRSALRNLVAGSVTTKMLTSTSVPVLVVR